MKSKQAHPSHLNKRFAALALTLVLLLSTASAAAALEFATVYNTTRLNLRQGPSTSSTWLGAYSKGTWIEITGTSGDWYAVTTPDGKTGYMSGNFLSKGITANSTVAIVKNPVSTQFLNLRKTPSYSAQVLGIYYNGTPALVLGEDNGWYRVRIDGVEGYFRSEFVQLTTTVGSDDIATIVTPNNSAMNLREGPGKQYASLRQFAGGRYVMVLNRGTGWWKVSIDNYLGYMMTDFLKDGLTQGGTTDNSGGGTTPSPVSGAYALVANPVSTRTVNLRQGPSTAYTVIDEFANGTRMSVLGQGSEWCWVTVDSTSQTGYMMTKYMALYNLPATPTKTISHPLGSFVNLRSGPSMSGTKVLTRMPDGVTVEVLAPGADWAKVKYNGMTGYAVTYFMK